MNIRQTFASYILSISLFFAVILSSPIFFDSYTLVKLGCILLGATLGFILMIPDLYRGSRLVIIFGLLLLGSQLISLILSTNRYISFFGHPSQEGYGFYAFLIYIPFALSIAHLPNKGRHKVEHFFIVASCLAGISCIIESMQTGVRPNGLEGQPILSAIVIGIAFLLSIRSLILTLRENNRQYVVYLLTTGVLFTSLLSTESNSILLGIIISFGIAGVVFVLKKGKQIYRLLILALIVVLLGLITQSILMSEQFSLNQRVKEYRAVAQMMKEKLFIPPSARLTAGYGQNTAGDYYKNYRSENLPKAEQNWDLIHIRSLLTETLYTNGIIGLSILLALMAFVVIKQIKNNDLLLLPLSFFFIFVSAIYFLFPTQSALMYSYFFTILVDDYMKGKGKGKGKETDQKKKQTKRLLIQKDLRKSIILVCTSLFEIVMIASIVSFIVADYSYKKGDFANATLLNPFQYFYPFQEGYLAYDKLFVLRKTDPCRNTGTCYDKYSYLYKTAHRALDEAIKRNSHDSYSYQLLGTILVYEWYDRGQTDKSLLRQAIVYHKKALQFDQHNFGYWDDVGNAYMSLKEYKEAELFFLKSVSINPKYVGGYEHLRDLYNTTGETEKKARIQKTLSSLD